MIDRTTIALLILCLALAGGVAWQWRNPPSVQSVLERRGAAPDGRGEAPGVVAPTFAPVTSYEEIVARPLFSQDRRPPPEAPAPTVAPVAGGGSYALEGVASTPGKQVAVVRNTLTRKVYRAGKGESIEGWLVAEVAARSVVLERGSQRQTLELETTLGGPGRTVAPVTVPGPQVPPRMPPRRPLPAPRAPTAR